MSDSSSSEDALDQTQTFGDIVERNVGSFSQSGMNCQTPDCRRKSDKCVREAYITLIDQKVSSDVEQFQNHLQNGHCPENITGSSNISFDFSLTLTENHEEQTCGKHDNEDYPLVKAQEVIFSCPIASQMKTIINT